MDELLSQFAGLQCTDRGELVQNFCRILQCDQKVGEFFLESSNWDVQRAVNAFMSTVGDYSKIVYESTTPPQAVFNTATGIPPSSQYAPGQVVPCVFEFANSGTTPWPTGCYFKCVEGVTFGVQPVQLPPAKVHQRVPISVELQMPPTPGTYAGTFQLISSHGFFSEVRGLRFVNAWNLRSLARSCSIV